MVNLFQCPLVTISTNICYDICEDNFGDDTCVAAASFGVFRAVFVPRVVPPPFRCKRDAECA